MNGSYLFPATLCHMLKVNFPFNPHLYPELYSQITHAEKKSPAKGSPSHFLLVFSGDEMLPKTN